eukprot:1850064-Rhodomonas_salina.2
MKLRAGIPTRVPGSRVVALPGYPGTRSSSQRLSACEPKRLRMLTEAGSQASWRQMHVGCVFGETPTVADRSTAYKISHRYRYRAYPGILVSATPGASTMHTKVPRDPRAVGRCETV